MSNAILNEAKEELEDLLDRLGVEGQELRELARQVTLRGIELASASLTDQDTSVGQAALKASVKNLEAAGSVAVAHSIVSFTNSIITRVGMLVVNVAFQAV